MTTLNENLELLIHKCGGLGLFQAMAITIFIVSKGSVAWSTMMMSFGAAVPDWWCISHNRSTNGDPYNSPELRIYKSCTAPMNSTVGVCTARVYSTDMLTLVNEWDLVCEKDWVTASITTIQMGGLLVSGVLAGQLGDTIGRKTTFYLALAVLVVCNTISPFSVSWQMFAAMRFFTGIGCGSFLTVSYTFIVEFVPLKYRPMIMAIPIWPLSTSLYALVLWWLHDWRSIHYATVIYTAPVVISLLIMPESFRWLVSHNKLKRGENVIKQICRLNRTPVPDLKELFDLAQQEEQSRLKEKRYTFIDICKNRDLMKKTIVVAFTWMSCGYTYYAISFGVDALSGDLYLNMFLLNVVEIPSLLLTWFFNHFIGRRYTYLLFSIICGIGGLAVGIVQVTEFANKGLLVNIFAMTSKLGVAGAWAAFMVFTLESYPTVVRNIGFGIANSSSRIGAMIAPQMVFLSKKIPGILYFLCGALMIVTSFTVLVMPETKGKALEDMIEKKDNKITTTSR